MAEWLALSLPAKRLEDERLMRSLDYLENMLDSQQYHVYLQAASSRDLVAVAHAAHAACRLRHAGIRAGRRDRTGPRGQRQGREVAGFHSFRNVPE